MSNRIRGRMSIILRVSIIFLVSSSLPEAAESCLLEVAMIKDVLIAASKVTYPATNNQHSARAQAQRVSLTPNYHPAAAHHMSRTANPQVGRC